MSNRKVVVVGAGNAGLCAALSAREQGASVIVLECAPEEERGGNSRFTAGAIRIAYEGVDDLKKLMPDLSAHEIEMTDDWFRLTWKRYHEIYFPCLCKNSEYCSLIFLTSIMLPRFLAP